MISGGFWLWVSNAINFEGESPGLLREASEWDGMTNLTTLFGAGASGDAYSDGLFLPSNCQ
jgi:hypothetical protein